VRVRGVLGCLAVLVLAVACVGPDTAPAPGTQRAAREPDTQPSVEPTVAQPAATTAEAVTATPSPTDTGVAKENAARPEIAIEPLAAGAKPPQFIVVSFDGACEDELFKHYLDLAERNSARFTFFLSGLCLLPDGRKNEYAPPLKDRGSSSIGFTAANDVPERIRNLSVAYERGHEIGTHALGHFCGAGGVAEWGSEHWRSELTQFDAFLDNWRTHLGPELSADVPSLPFNSSVVEGIRTPCLQGNREAMWPVWQEAGFTYDASNTGSPGWPKKIDGFQLWEFPLQTIPVVGFDRGALSMDYNFMCVQNGCSTRADPPKVKQVEKSTYDTYMQATQTACNGNRSPLFFGNHFNTWVGSAYRDALTRFVDDAKSACPDVQFVSNRDLVRWLSAQDPAVLEGLRAA
jgi:hypothetical protein